MNKIKVITTAILFVAITGSVLCFGLAFSAILTKPEEADLSSADSAQPATTTATQIFPVMKIDTDEAPTKKPEVVQLSEKNMVVMDQVFDDQSVTRVMQDLQKLSDTLDKDATIYLVMNSPGGSVASGQLLISFARALPQKVKTLTIFAASMGFQTVQSLDERLILDTGTLMSHRAKFGAQGQAPGELFSRINWIMSMIDALDANAANRMGITFDEYRKMIHDEYWAFGIKAVADRSADRMVLAKCDKSLSGVRSSTVETMFGPVEVQISKCPLLPGIISVKPVNAKDENADKAVRYAKELYGNKNQFVEDYILTNKISSF